MGAADSPPLELRRPLAQERANALLRVLGRERRDEALLLDRDALVEVALVGDLFCELGRGGRLPRERAPPLDRGVEQLLSGLQAGGEVVLFAVLRTAPRTRGVH